MEYASYIPDEGINIYPTTQPEEDATQGQYLAEFNWLEFSFLLLLKNGKTPPTQKKSVVP